MRQWADFSLVEGEGGGEGTTLAIEGPLRVHAIGDLDRRLEQLDHPFNRVDLSGVTEIDTTGAWLAWQFAEDHDAEIVGESEQARRLIAAISSVEDRPYDPPPEPGPIKRVAAETGEIVAGWGTGFVAVLGFLGATLSSFGSIIAHPGRMRWKALVRQMQLVGVNSLPIIGLMSFLIGIVIAQQGAVQLAQFGAEIYTINLTGRLSLRELGILMTAIMVAGRSGSAFAAQIGTMNLTEEIDAMRTIGVSPMEALVVPRVLAAMLMMPLLGFYSAVLAIIGGAFISAFALDIPFFTFLSRIQEVVPIHDLWIGLIKGPVFGLIVSLAGCYHGMQVKGNAEEVGLRTTQAVVTAIFTVIVLDAFFAIFFSELGWE
ncbi:ABC transporter inner membrane subunit [Novosphingobium marinum]|uniref:Phospholipid/cholesterol/gamma-HCH transport system permease protein n=1 Tax=Novosphingobium marinum TaxID=1514948 RepID=A0A7Z0BVM8_9SPHN|nr:ABC transporter permease [Novosphingobium marinum]NYH96438.1 phospholipid/cholesterol/gamma-HCH transport system permease protein [Novosphingobium marinum]GGC35233.1 ABC transporter inner membrane subunit [Novosphingobium marinum]